MIRWNGRTLTQSNVGRMGINPPPRQNMLLPLRERQLVGNLAIVVGVRQEEGSVPSTPTPTPTSTNTPTPSSTSTPTPTPTSSETSTPTPTPTLTSTPTPSSIPISSTYVRYSAITLTSTSHTYSNIGYDGPGTIVVGVHGIGTQASNPSISTITLGGVAMTQYANYQRQSTQSDDGTSFSVFGVLEVTGGTSADLVITTTSNVTDTGVSIWRVQNNTSSTPYISTGTTAYSNGVFRNNISVDLTTLAGVSEGVAIVTESESTTHTWTNATERYDAYFTGAQFSQTGTSSRNINVGLGSVENPTTLSVIVFN